MFDGRPRREVGPPNRRSTRSVILYLGHGVDDMAYVDWNGDHNTPVPHIFCRYKRFRQHPYETIRVFKKIGDSERLEEVRNFRALDSKAIM